MICPECGETLNVIGKRVECKECGLRQTVKWVYEQYSEWADAERD
jgi:DNA-directed RNA polymerase subunit RPC12/RpoP